MGGGTPRCGATDACPVAMGCTRREGTSEAAPEAVRGRCRTGWGRLLLVTNATDAGTWRQGDSGWA